MLYVDRFCPEKPSRADLDFLEQFVEYIFIWAYSLRAQYANVGWQIAQNFIMGKVKKNNVVNGFNIYKVIVAANTQGALLSKLAEKLAPITIISDNKKDIDVKDDKEIFKNYLSFFKQFKYLLGAKK